MRKRRNVSRLNQQTRCPPAHCIEEVIVSIAMFAAYSNKHLSRDQLPGIMAKCIEVMLLPWIVENTFRRTEQVVEINHLCSYVGGDLPQVWHRYYNIACVPAINNKNVTWSL